MRGRETNFLSPSKCDTVLQSIVLDSHVPLGFTTAQGALKVPVSVDIPQITSHMPPQRVPKNTCPHNLLFKLP